MNTTEGSKLDAAQLSLEQYQQRIADAENVALRATQDVTDAEQALQKAVVQGGVVAKEKAALTKARQALDDAIQLRDMLKDGLAGIQRRRDLALLSDKRASIADRLPSIAELLRRTSDLVQELRDVHQQLADHIQLRDSDARYWSQMRDRLQVSEPAAFGWQSGLAERLAMSLSDIDIGQVFELRKLLDAK